MSGKQSTASQKPGNCKSPEAHSLDPNPGNRGEKPPKLLQKICKISLDGTMGIQEPVSPSKRCEPCRCRVGSIHETLINAPMLARRVVAVLAHFCASYLVARQGSWLDLPGFLRSFISPPPSHPVRCCLISTGTSTVAHDPDVGSLPTAEICPGTLYVIQRSPTRLWENGQFRPRLLKASAPRRVSVRQGWRQRLVIMVF